MTSRREINVEKNVDDDKVKEEEEENKTKERGFDDVLSVGESKKNTMETSEIKIEKKKNAIRGEKKKINPTLFFYTSVHF